MEIYESDEYLNGMEIYYLVDGDVLKYTLHHRIKRLEKQKVNPMTLLQGDNQLNQTHTSSVLKRDGERPPFRKTPIYFKRDEYIVRIRLSG